MKHRQKFVFSDPKFLITKDRWKQTLTFLTIF